VPNLLLKIFYWKNTAELYVEVLLRKKCGM